MATLESRTFQGTHSDARQSDDGEDNVVEDDCSDADERNDEDEDDEMGRGKCRARSSQWLVSGGGKDGPRTRVRVGVDGLHGSIGEMHIMTMTPRIRWLLKFLG